jgi:hypothetical protein
MGIARVDSVVIHGVDHAVAQGGKRVGGGVGDLDDAEVQVMDQLLGPLPDAAGAAGADAAGADAGAAGVGGLAALIQLRESGKIGAIGAALNAECPVHPDDPVSEPMTMNSVTTLMTPCRHPDDPVANQ